MHLTDIACTQVGKRSVKPFIKQFDRVKDLGEEEIQQSPKFRKGVQQRSSSKNEARNQAEVASCCRVHLAVLGAGESSSMSSSSLLISIRFLSSLATADEVTEEVEEVDVMEELLLEVRTAMDGMLGSTAGAIGTEPMTTS